MVGWREDARDAAELDDGPEVHHGDVIGEVAHDGEIVRDEDQRGAPGGLQFPEQIDDRRLDRDVERRDGLVRDDDVGIARQRARDRDPLLLASRQLAGLAPRQLRRELHDLEQARDAGPRVGRRALAQAAQRPPDRVAHGVARVERALGVLEDHLKLPPQRAAAAVDAEPADLGAVEHDVAIRGDLDAGQHLRERGLAAARLADDRERLATTGDDVDGTQRAHRRPAGTDETGARVVELAETLRRDHRVRRVRGVRRRPLRAPSRPRRQLGGAHAGDAMTARAVARPQRDRGRRAPRAADVNAAGSKAAAGWPRERGLDLAGNGYKGGVTLVAPERRQAVEKAAGIGMAWVGEDLADRSLLDELAAVHHPDPVADADDRPEVVADEEDGRATTPPQLPDEIQHRRLDGDVQARRRLVHDEQRGLRDERHRDDDALLLASG